MKNIVQFLALGVMVFSVWILTLTWPKKGPSYEERKHLRQQATADYVRTHSCVVTEERKPHSKWSYADSKIETNPGFKIYGCTSPEIEILISNDEIQP